MPFFGDQPFWGARVQEKGVGPAPIPVKHFDLEKLVSAIQFMLDPAVSLLYTFEDTLILLCIHAGCVCSFSHSQFRVISSSCFVLTCSYNSNFQVKKAALELAKGMEKEDGIQGAVNAFHKHLRSHRNFANLLNEPSLEELNHNRHHGLMFRIKRKCKSLLHH